MSGDDHGVGTQHTLYGNIALFLVGVFATVFGLGILLGSSGDPRSRTAFGLGIIMLPVLMLSSMLALTALVRITRTIFSRGAQNAT